MKKNSILNDINNLNNNNDNNNNNNNNFNEIYSLINLMNLNPLSKGDNLIYINNIKTTHRYIKEFTADEMLKLIKRGFEKKILDFRFSINLIRKISREILYFKYGEKIKSEE